jgi:hypothetical protein
VQAWPSGQAAGVVIAKFASEPRKENGPTALCFDRCCHLFSCSNVMRIATIFAGENDG